MKPAPFRYFAPTSLDECVDLLGEHGDEAKLLAGGQSLVPMMNFRLAKPAALIDLNGVSELAYVGETASGGMRIGALTRQRALERDPELRRRNPLLAEAIPYIGHFQIRNRGTVGGSIAHADPAAELPAVLCALDGSIRVRGAGRGADDRRRGLLPNVLHRRSRPRRGRDGDRAAPMAQRRWLGGAGAQSALRRLRPRRRGLPSPRRRGGERDGRCGSALRRRRRTCRAGGGGAARRNPCRGSHARGRLRRGRCGARPRVRRPRLGLLSQTSGGGPDAARFGRGLRACERGERDERARGAVASGERGGRRSGCRTPAHLGGLPPQCIEADRHASRMRARRLRRLHRSGRRGGGPLLPPICRASAGAIHHDDRRACGRRRPPPPAKSPAGAQRSPVRVLHTRRAHDRHGVPG